MRLTSRSSKPPSAVATAIIAFRMSSARKFAARSGTTPLLAQLPPIVPGRPRFAKLACCREIGIQLGSISLYDAGDASFIPLTPRSASDAAQSDLPRRYAAWPLPPRRRRHCRARAAAPGSGHAHTRAPALDRADALAAPADQRRELLSAAHVAHGLPHRRRGAA